MPGLFQRQGYRLNDVKSDYGTTNVQMLTDGTASD